jgi:CRISPR-associated protein Csm5
LYLIDEKKFREAFDKDDKIAIAQMDDFMQGVEKYVNVDKTEFLKDFIEETLLKPFTQVVKNKDGYNAKATGNATAISTILKNGRRPFISGSTLKGAIKTAFLYEWLLSGKKEQLKNVIFDIQNFYTENVFDLDERDELQQKKIEKNINSKEWELLEIIKRRLNEKTIKLGRSIDKVIDGFLHNEPENTPRDFHLFQVSDSTLFDEDDLALYETARFNLKKGKYDIPVFKEAIDEEKDAIINLRIFKGISHSGLSFLNEATWEDIAAKLNAFSIANVGQEINLLNLKKGKLLQVNEATTKGYEQFLTDSATQNGMKEIIQGALPTEAYITLGSGKTYFYNSIGLALYKEDKKSFDKFARIFGLGKASQEFFPITRALNLDYKPLGWVKLEPLKLKEII